MNFLSEDGPVKWQLAFCVWEAVGSHDTRTICRTLKCGGVQLSFVNILHAVQ